MIFDRNVLALYIAGIFQSLTKRAQTVAIRVSQLAVEESNHWQRGLLRARGEWPHRYRSSNSGHEIASSHRLPEVTDQLNVGLQRKRSNQEITSRKIGFKVLKIGLKVFLRSNNPAPPMSQ